MSIATNAQIELDDHGVAWISGTKVKVIEVAIDKLTHGSSPEEIHFQYPHLSLSQIHVALAYYYDHQVDFDAEIQSRWEEVNQFANPESESPLQQRLRALKRRQ